MKICNSLLSVPAVFLIGVTLTNDCRSEVNGYHTPLIVAKTTLPLRQAVTALKQAIRNNNYVFIRQQNINSRLTVAADENKRVVLVYFCNFSMLNRALKVDRRVGVFLPCKVTLIQRKDYVELIAINPKMISHRFFQERLGDICDQLQHDYNRILDEATL